MTLSPSLLKKILVHSTHDFPREACGLIVTSHGRDAYVPCKNLAQTNEHFVIDPADYAAAEDKGEITAIVHSHPTTAPSPSQADLIGIEKSGIPWIIVNPLSGAHTITKPSGYVAPLIGREFSHGIVDCLTLIQDYYASIGIILPHSEREDEWWLKGQNLYLDLYESWGFTAVTEPQKHDVVLIKMGSPVPNHGAIYLGENIILHHVMRRLSCREVFGGYWQRHATHYLRHKDLM